MQRIQKTLEEANIKLDSVISDIIGVSGRAILRALIAGETDPAKLASLASSRIKATREELREALRGRVLPHHRFLLQLHLQHIDQIDSFTAQKRLIEADIGIALMPESSIQEELRLGTLRTIDILDLQATVPIHVLYRKSGYLNGASRTLLSLISNIPVRPSTTRRNRKRK